MYFGIALNMIRIITTLLLSISRTEGCMWQSSNKKYCQHYYCDERV